MLPRFLRINAMTRADRHRTITALRDAVNTSGGWITDFKFFSNYSVCINFEIDAAKVRALHSALKALDIRLTEESVAALDAFSGDETKTGGNTPEESEVVGTLQVSFIHNEPDLRIEVPPIPG